MRAKRRMAYFIVGYRAMWVLEWWLRSDEGRFWI
jgi:hypothetical protein